jgi:zinc transporter 1
MGMSRSSRIVTLLVIDVSFFFLEIIAGIMSHSLALIADSFHMVSR